VETKGMEDTILDSNASQEKAFTGSLIDAVTRLRLERDALRANLAEAEREALREAATSFHAMQGHREHLALGQALAALAPKEPAYLCPDCKHAAPDWCNVRLTGDAVTRCDDFAPKVDPAVQAIRDAVARDEALLAQYELVNGGRERVAPKEEE
jgi:hypothetical protein